MEMYKPRYASYHGLFSKDGWEIKKYFLTIQPKDKILSNYENILHKALLRLPNCESEHETGCGFFIIHKAKDGDYALLSRWYGVNMIKHHVYSLSYESGRTEIIPIEPSDIIACVWELEIIYREKNYWLSTYMKNLTAISKKNYFKLFYEGEV